MWDPRPPYWLKLMKRIEFHNLRGDLFYNHNLADYTSWRTGGNAERFYHPADLSDLQNFLSQLPEDEPLTWIGLGSNVLIRDGGIAGTVVLTLNRLNRIELIPKNIIRAEAGVTCAKLAKVCVKNGFERGAFFAGIPGTVGGALRMNAGAFGGETWEHVIKVETCDRKGQLHEYTPDHFKIQYRQVDGLKDEFFVTGCFQFESGNSQTAQKTLRELLKKRNATQPIGRFSCGSVFRNPPGDFAARLIESAELKGLCCGDAVVSEKHANFILNRGHATSADIEQLIQKVVDRVYQVHGIRLIAEVHVIGKKD